jgi:hypothetical protein
MTSKQMTVCICLMLLVFIAIGQELADSGVHMAAQLVIAVVFFRVIFMVLKALTSQESLEREAGTKKDDANSQVDKNDLM